MAPRRVSTHVKALASSLAAHIAVLGVMVLVFRSQSEKIWKKELTREVPIEVRTSHSSGSDSTSKGAAAPSQKKSGKESKHRKAGPPSLDLGKLGIPGGLFPGNSPSGNSKSDGQSGDTESEIFSGADGNEIFRRMTVQSASLLQPFLAAIHLNISNRLTYPDEIVADGREGVVNLQFELDRRGVLQTPLTKRFGDDPYLRVLAARAIRKALAEPLDSNLWMKKDRLKVVTTFDFRFTYREQNLPEAMIKIQKNALNFRKVVLTSSPIQVKADTNTQTYAIFANPIALAQTLFKPKANAAALERYRDDPDF